MYHANAYYDLIINFFTVQKYLKMALSYKLYKMKDVIKCINILHFPVSFF